MNKLMAFSALVLLLSSMQAHATSPSDAHGIVVLDGSSGILKDANLQTSEANAQGIFMLGFSSGNQMVVSNATVATSGVHASAIVPFAITGITNTLQATNATFSAAHADLMLIAGGIANIDFNNVSANASPDHLLLLVEGIPSATLNLITDSSNLSGDMQVFGGNIGNVVLGNSTWTGAAHNVTNLTVSHSEWNLTAPSTITNQLTNAGLIDFVSQGNVFKTLAIGGPYFGQNGTIGLNTFLGSDSAPSDLLILNGSSATGSTLLNIKNTTGPGAFTEGNGILIVNAINGGTTDPGAFSLSNLVIAGPYEYSLFRGSVDANGPDNWYLRSTQASSTRPNFRQEVSLYTAIPSTALLYGRMLLDTLHQRVGDSLQCDCECEQTFFRNGWARVVDRNGKQRGRNIFHEGPNFTYNLLAFQSGLDVYHRVGSDGSRDHLGVLGAIGHGRSSVRHFTHAHAGKNKFDAYTAGAYWTHFGSCGWYIDNVFETNWYRNIRAHSKRIRPLKTHGVEYAGSIESGYPLQLNCITLEPQAQVIYQSLSLDHTKDIAAKVRFHRAHAFLGRIGLRLANTWCFRRPITTWLRADFWRDFSGRPKTFFSSEDGPVGFHSNLKGNRFEGTLGLTAELTDILSFYCSFTGDVYLNGRGHSYYGVAGLKGTF